MCRVSVGGVPAALGAGVDPGEHHLAASLAGSELWSDVGFGLDAIEPAVLVEGSRCTVASAVDRAHVPYW